MGWERGNVQDEVPISLPEETPQIGAEKTTLSERRNQDFAQQQRKRNPLISCHRNTIAFVEAVGKDELGGINVGGRQPQVTGFRYKIHSTKRTSAAG